MGLFGKWRQQVRVPEVPIDVAKAVATISARQAFLEALATHLVTELSVKKRDHVLGQLEEVVRERMILPPPSYVPSSNEQDFRDTLRQAMKVLIEKATRTKDGI